MGEALAVQRCKERKGFDREVNHTRSAVVLAVQQYQVMTQQ